MATIVVEKNGEQVTLELRGFSVNIFTTKEGSTREIRTDANGDVVLDRTTPPMKLTN